MYLLKNLLPKLRRSKLLIVIATLCIILIFQSPTYPAEKIKFNLSVLGFKIEVADLEMFAESGQISDRLNFYLKRISPQQREKLREFLQQSYDVEPIFVYRFSRTSVGTKLLERLGDIVQIPEDINGFYGLRAALVKAAAYPEGVNFINFLKNFPTDIKLNLGEVLGLVNNISNTEKEVQSFVASLETEDTIRNKGNTNNLPDLSVLGKFKTSQETLDFYDLKRDRHVITDFYLPQETINNVPLIIVSNGLGAKRSRFAELATYLASYGFAVAIPEHPGTSHRRQQEFIEGLHQENFEATDFVDRPLDISFVLDSLAKMNRNELNNKLDLENVGIFGYSIGGTTALSLAGANLDFAHLERECNETLDLTNISTLYQCRALEITKRNVSLADDRIDAAFLFVPFGNILFSESELKKVKTPMLWQVVDKDYLTSLTKEQLPAFKALNSQERYLVITENLPHTTATFSKQRSASQQNETRIGRKYQNILSLVFFKKYLTDNNEYGDYLNNSLVKAITEEPYTLHLLENRIIQSLDERRAK